MVIMMDVSGDQAMSSASPADLSDQLAQGSPSPFQTQVSDDGDEHEDEQSKSSNQTIVTMQQAGQQQATGEQEAEDERKRQHSQQQQEQRMVVSGGSSFEEEDEKRLMSVDGDEDQLGKTIPKGVSLKLEQDDLEARLNQAKSKRFNVNQHHHQQGQQQVDSSLVAQMRDIVEGNQSGGSSAARRVAQASQQQRQGRLEDKENKSAEPADNQVKGQPKSSSDSLDNQNDHDHSRGSMDSAGQRRARQTGRAHCRHHGHHHHHPHHHHHHHHRNVHHHHHHRHRQSISGSSLPGQVEGGASTEPSELLVGKSTVAPSHQNAHLANHHHHHHGHRHRHSNASQHHAHHHQHGHHAHHHHHPHHYHHNQQQDQSKRTGSERNSNQRLSLAMIETGSDRPEGQPKSEVAAAAAASGAGGAGTKAIESNNSSMSSVSCSAPKQPAQNPSQSQPESKSSWSPPSDEQSAATAATNSTTNVVGQQDGGAEMQMATGKEQPSGQDHSNNHHHHQHHHQRHHHHANHHHHNCYHRSHKRRLVLETAGSGDKPSEADVGQQDDMTTPVNNPLGQQTGKREHLKDLASSANTAAGDGELGSDDKSNRLHHHHHHHHNNRHHHHHHHRAHRHQTRANGQLSADEHQSSQAISEALQNSPGKSLHQHHCVHHRHRHHHHCSRQQQQAHKSRQKSVSQTDVAQKRDDATAATAVEPSAGGQSKSNDAQLAQESSESMVQASEELVEMETSPPPQLPLSADAHRQSATVLLDGVAQQATECATSQQVSQSVLPNSNNRMPEGKESAELCDADEMARKPPNKANQEANRAVSSNQENFRSGDSTAANDHSGRQQEANKLTRQMSSQSSRKSQKEEVPGGGGADDLNGRNQSEHLRECAERALQPAAINQQPDELRQVVESGLLSDRRCRLCWCCCCPCSALSTRDGATRAVEKPRASQGPPSSPVNTNYPSLSNVPLDEIRSWGDSFDKLMRCSDGRKVFQDFLRCEYSEENILFWSACEELKKEKDSRNIAAKARDIYEDYISILSSKEVSLDSRVRDIINNNIKKPTSNIFDEAQLQIYTLMHRDSYPRFINSIMYKKLAQIPVSNSRKSSS